MEKNGLKWGLLLLVICSLSCRIIYIFHFPMSLIHRDPFMHMIGQTCRVSNIAVYRADGLEVHNLRI